MRFPARYFVVALLVNLLSPVNVGQATNLTDGFSSAPRNITQVSVSGGVTLSWNTPADTATGITGYQIQKSATGLNGSWVDVVTTTTSPYTVLGLANSAIYLRIAGITSAGTGAYGYPWTPLYKTVTKTRSGNAIIYEYNGSATVSTSFTRVRYLFEDTITTSYNYADVDFYKWAQDGTVTTDTTTARTAQPTIPYLQVPSPAVPFVVQAKVSDLTVFSSVASKSVYSNAITNGFGINGRLELWDENYATNVNGLKPVGNDGLYDFDDKPNTNGSYGSFQVHNTDLGKTIFAWNEHSGANPDIGFGDGAGIAVQADWTFCYAQGSCPAVTSFALTIYVNSPITPGVDTTAPIVARIDAKTLIRNSDTISVQSNEIGNAYLVRNTITVTNASSITSAAANVVNSVSISSVNSPTTLTTNGLLDGTYNLYAVDLLGNVSAAITSTVTLDSTAPTFVSASIHSSGSTLLITLSENVTHTGMGDLMYSVSDGGAPLVVGSVGVGGNVVQVSFTRPIPAGAAVTFSYVPTGGTVANRWKDAAGNELAAISATSVTNGSTSSISISLTVPTVLNKGSQTTISIAAPVAGKVTFTMADKRIPGCAGIRASGTFPVTVSCTFKPALTANRKITATLVPTNSSIASTSSSVQRFILKRTTLR